MSRIYADCFENMRNFRSQGRFCDLAVEVKGETFSVHRVILAAQSAFFSDADVDDFKITINDIEPATFRDFLDHVYGLDVELDVKRAEACVKAAEIVGCESLQVMCQDIIRTGNIKPTDCVEKWVEGVRDKNEDMKKKALECIGGNIMDLIKHNIFVGMPKSAMKRFLQDDDVHYTCSELELCQIVFQWIEHNTKCLTSPMELLKHVDFELIDAKEVFGMHSQISLGQNPSVKFIPKSQAIFAVAADQTRLLKKICDLKDTEFMHDLIVPSQPLLEEADQAVMIGQNCFIVEKCGMKRMFCFNIEQKIWRRLANMEVEANGRAMFILNGFIYLVGGKLGNRAHARVDRYSILRNHWQQMNDCPVKAYDQAACVGNTTEAFISGGTKLDKYHYTCVHQYNLKDDLWKRIFDLYNAMSSHYMMSYPFSFPKGWYFIGGFIDGKGSNQVCMYEEKWFDGYNGRTCRFVKDKNYSFSLPNHITSVARTNETDTIYCVCGSNLMCVNLEKQTTQVIQELPADTQCKNVVCISDTDQN